MTWLLFYYINKLISRNKHVIHKAENIESYSSNLEWATNLNSRLHHLEYDQRELAIKKIKEVLNTDYNNSMGIEKEEGINKTI